MIIGLGSDLCDIRRVEETLGRFGDRFVKRCFTEIEQRKSRKDKELEEAAAKAAADAKAVEDARMAEEVKLAALKAADAKGKAAPPVAPAPAGTLHRPAGKAGEAQTLTLLPETGAREVAQD